MNASLKTSVVDTKQWYEQYYGDKGATRNNILRDPGALFQLLAHDIALTRALRSVSANQDSSLVLDVGCGEGGNIFLLLRLGFTPTNLFGIDIQEDRIARAKSKNPLITFQCGDAACQNFPNNTFDLVMESALFIHLTDDMLAKRIAAEMIRVTRPGGSLLIADWRYPKPGNPNYKAVSARRIRDLFDVGSSTVVYKTFRGPLVPPIGRFLSKHCSPPYFLLHTLFPFLVGHTVTVLKKVES